MNTEQCLRIKEMINQADCIIVGAGAGLSVSGGLDYSNETFSKLYPEFVSKYGMTDWYTSSFFEFDNEEERWNYWAKHIDYSFIKPKQYEVYKDLFNAIKDKEYFVITTNVDGQFLKGNFDEDRIFEVQGSYGKIQCQNACHNKLYDNTKLVGKMLISSESCRIKSELIPKCPICNGNMEMNLRKDNLFIEDEKWQYSNEKYEEFLNKNINKRLVLLELGVGFNTPGIIRYPFEKLVYNNQNIELIRINDKYIETVVDISDKVELVNDDCAEILKRI